VYGKYFERGEFDLPSGAGANDEWHKGQGGFRIDWEPTDANTLTLQGDLYEGRENQTRAMATPTLPFGLTNTFNDRFAGGNVLGRWTHRFEGDSELQVQLYFDHTERENLVPEEDRDTFDIEAQHRFQLGRCQEITWGLGYRWSGDMMTTNFGLFFGDPSRSVNVYSAFVQDEITLVRDRLRLTLGSKFEHNDFTGFEVQPSARLAWTPNHNHTLWAAVSRAVSTPSRSEDDVRLIRPPVEIAPGFSAYPVTLGNSSLESESLLAYELGYRVWPHERVTIDAVAFYNDYDNLLTVALGPPPPFALPLPPLTFNAASSLTAKSYGAELAAQIRVTDWWRLRASYAYLYLDVNPNAPDPAGVEQLYENNEAQNRVSIQSQMDLPGNLRLDAGMHYVGELGTPGIGRYVVLNVGLAWRPCKNTELSIVGTDLLDDRHPEAAPISNPSPVAEVPRGVFGKLTIRF